MKKKSKMMWCLFVACVIAAIIMRVFMEVQELEYEEIQVRVVSAETKQIRNRRTHSTYDFYVVKVAYKGEVQELGNAYKTSQYKPGSYVKAYVSNGKLFANIEGVSTSTPIAKIYFVFLFGSFGLLFVALYYTGKANQEKQE